MILKFQYDSIIVGKSDKDNDNYDLNTFSCRDITQYTIPSNIKRISSFAFSDCKNLDHITFPEDSVLKSISSNAFYQTSLTNISIPSHVSQIEDQAFSNCFHLKTITFSEDSKLKKIGKCSFLFISIEKITIPSHVSQIGR